MDVPFTRTAPSVLMASCSEVSDAASEAETISKARVTLISRVISITGLTLAFSTKPCSMPTLVKSSTGVAGRSGMTPEFSKRVSLACAVDA